jgi:D-glycero-beta-D-manno-heptose 1-phosphate adenylyltransferase
VIHLGHIDDLEKARQLGDKPIIGLNSDRSVTELKGVQRPIINVYARARLLAALQFVDIVILFDELTPMKLIEDIRPNILAKGGDYTIETIVGADFVLRYGGIVRIVYSIEGYSTTLLVESIRERTEK